MDYILVSIAVILQAITFSLTKLYQNKAGSSFKKGLEYTIIGSVPTIIIFLALNKFRLEYNMFAVLMALGMAFCATTYSILGLKVMEKGKVAFYTMFLMTGGMVVPYIWGLAFLNEEFSVLRSVGLVVIILSVIIINFGDKRPDIPTLLLCVAIFFLNGFTSVFSKLSQIGTEAVSSESFVVLSSSAKLVLCLPIWLFIKNKTYPGDKNPKFKSIVLIIVGGTVIGGVSYLLQLMGARNLPATVLYPMFTGGTIIFSAIAAWIFFREKPSKSLIIGMAICFIGTCMFL